jgi:predicted Fe-Mo cluster-binding NifX family protein
MLKYKVAIASTDGKKVDMHFGKCDAFTIAEVDASSGEYGILERRPVPPPCPSCGTHGDNDDAMFAVIGLISDCRAVIVSKIGRWPDSLLYERGIESIEYSGPIDEVLSALLARLTKQTKQAKQEKGAGANIKTHEA